MSAPMQAKLGEDGKPGFFAIASAPGADKENGTVELLIKSQGGTAEQLCAAAAGALRALHWACNRRAQALKGCGVKGVRGWRSVWPGRRLLC